jgi:hypothetical protein
VNLICVFISDFESVLVDPPACVIDPPACIVDPPACVVDPPACVIDPPACVIDPRPSYYAVFMVIEGGGGVGAIHRVLN